MARQTFIWTVLPHGRETTPAGNMLKLSLYLSPRLYGDSETQKTLNDYPDLIHLTASLRTNCQFRIHIDGLPPVEPASVESGANMIEPALWESMFNAATPVTPY